MNMKRKDFLLGYQESRFKYGPVKPKISLTDEVKVDEVEESRLATLLHHEEVLDAQLDQWRERELVDDSRW